MIDGGPATGYVKALVGCNGLGTETPTAPAAAPAPAPAAEPLTLDRLLRTACQASVSDFAGETSGGQAVAFGAAKAQTLLTPLARLELIDDLAKGLPHGTPPRLFLGVSEEALAFVRSLGGKPTGTPPAAEDFVIDDAAIQVGGLLVRAQAPAREE